MDMKEDKKLISELYTKIGRLEGELEYKDRIIAEYKKELKEFEELYKNVFVKILLKLEEK